jgi:8-oxo-dGTP pyrophosphatase MutT (NUDIX family)
MSFTSFMVPCSSHVDLVRSWGVVDRSLKDLETFLRERLAAPLPGPEAQRRFAPKPPRKGWVPDDQPPGAREAAALILLYPGENGASFPLTVRRHDLPLHPGQISLPGGALDPGEDPAEAALRETYEEIGIDPGDIRLIGPLSPLWIVSNFVMRPFVGIADRRLTFRPEPREVEALIETPVEWLRDPSRVAKGDRVRDNVRVEFPYFDFAGHRVWGATAMVLSEFAALLD